MGVVVQLNKFSSEGKAPNNILVCGESGNNTELFNVPSVHGVVVSVSVHKELLLVTLHYSSFLTVVVTTLSLLQSFRTMFRLAMHIRSWFSGMKKMQRIIQRQFMQLSDVPLVSSKLLGTSLGPDISARDLGFPYPKTNTVYPADVVVKFYVLYEKWWMGEVQKSSSVAEYLKSITHFNGVIIHPSGTERSLHTSIDALSSSYADKLGTYSLVASQIGSSSWMVRFDHWEMKGDLRYFCRTNLLLNMKPENAEGFEVVYTSTKPGLKDTLLGASTYPSYRSL